MATPTAPRVPAEGRPSKAVAGTEPRIATGSNKVMTVWTGFEKIAAGYMPKVVMDPKIS